MNKNTPHFPLFALLWVAISTLFLVACSSPSSQEPPSITIPPQATLPPESTATKHSNNTAIETAVSIPTATSQATKTPSPISPTPLATETAVSQVHTVQSGENLTIIANKFGLTTDSIQRANEIADGDAIYVGQELEIPAELATGEALAGDNTDRAILHNQFLCPSSEEMDLEGGTIIGRSAVCQIPIISYQFGEGDTSLVLVGGMHGGYEWNTILLAYEFLGYLRLNPEIIPVSLTITIVPNANPDGLFAVTRRVGRFTADDVDDNITPGRFNGNFVDLNRNWDCEWTPNATWGSNLVSGGSEPFSEPENQSLRDFILAAEPAAVVLYHSAATGVYASGCGQIDPASDVLTTIYSQASGYAANGGFHYYDITGDASNWLVTQGIPAITVELTTHESIDWRMNLAGLNALIDYIAFVHK